MANGMATTLGSLPPLKFDVSNMVEQAQLGDHAAKQAAFDKKVLAANERKKRKAETNIDRVGNKIILPAEPWMEIPEAIELLQERQKQDEQLYDVHEHVRGFPYDGAAAFYRVLVRRYGFVSTVSVKTWFGERKPTMLNIKVDVDETIQVPFGAYKLPGFKEPIKTGFCVDHEGGPAFSVTAQLKAADRHIIKELLLEAEKEVAENSIYRSKALIIETDEDGKVRPKVEPKFMSTRLINPDNLVLNRDIEELVEVTLWTPIKRAESCRKEGVSLKRINGLYGPYGTGKTLCAWVTAKIAVENGWTFVMCDNARGLTGALDFAKHFQPAVVFVEDIDRVAQERTDQADDIFTAVDGVLSKTDEIMVIYTTNHVDHIHKAMLRAGRTDALIPIDFPNGEAAEKLVRLYAGKRLEKGATFEKLGTAIAGTTPANIAEIVKRAKLSMIARDAKTINEEDLLVSAYSMKRHAELLQDVPASKQSDGDILAQALRRVTNGKLDFPEQFEKVKDDVKYMRDRF